MEATKSKPSKTGWTDPAWRYIKLTMLLWGLVQVVWLYFRIDRYSMFTTFLFLFMSVAGIVIRLQQGNEEDQH